MRISPLSGGANVSKSIMYKVLAGETLHERCLKSQAATDRLCKMSNMERRYGYHRALYFGAATIVVCAGAALFIGRLKLNVTLPHVLPATPQSATANTGRAGHYKVLHVMSYHLPWEWTETQLKGFKEALRGVNVEYRVVQLDAKRHSSEQWKLEAGAKAVEAIETWKPDLVFTGDDDAQKYVARHYVNSQTPIVFCAVNADPAVYGFTGSGNVSGVCEPTHFVQTVELLKLVTPGVQRIAMVTDTGGMWGPMIEMLKMNEDKLPSDVKVVGYHVLRTFEEYKAKMMEFQKTADAIGMLGIFEFKDANGANVPLETVQEWTIKNSRLPDFSFWKDRIDKGTLCAVTVSGYAQGYEAGRIARGILTEGRSPDSYAFTTTNKGVSVVNLARIKKLVLKVDSRVLMAAEVVDTMP